MATYRYIVEHAMQELGVLASGASAPDKEALEGAQRFVMWLKAHSLNAYYPIGAHEIHHRFTSAGRQFTVGPASGESPPDIVVESLPSFITFVEYKGSVWQEFRPIDEANREKLSAVGSEYSSGPNFYYFERNSDGDTATLYFDYLTRVNDEIRIVGRSYLSAEQITEENLGELQINAPDEYEQSFVLNLAMELANKYGVVLSPSDKRAARKALNRIKARNKPPSSLRLEPALANMGSDRFLGGRRMGGRIY